MEPPEGPSAGDDGLMGHPSSSGMFIPSMDVIKMCNTTVDLVEKQRKEKMDGLVTRYQTYINSPKKFLGIPVRGSREYTFEQARSFLKTHHDMSWNWSIWDAKSIGARNLDAANRLLVQAESYPEQSMFISSEDFSLINF